jgi:hypothetical protein
VQALRSVCAIPCRQEYDVLVTHGGRVAVNHYQTAKAACAVMPIAAPGAMLVLAASNADPEPVGKPEYRLLLARLRESGPAGFLKLLRDPGWQFVPDQWEVQKWAQCFLKLGGFDRLIYCTTGIPAEELARLPGRSGDELVPAAGPRDPQAMVQEAVRHAVRQKRDERGTEPRCAVLIDGPYGVPVLG